MSIARRLAATRALARLDELRPELTQQLFSIKGTLLKFGLVMLRS